jgi:hypothetical protein
VCRNKKINWVLNKEDEKLYLLRNIENTPTTKKICQPWATSATASVAIHGSLPPIPADRFYSVGRGLRSARSVFVFSRGEVSSIVFCTRDS